MNDGRLQHGLALAVIVLALWTTDVVASTNPRCAGTRGWLFGLSIEELMELSIDSLDGGLPCNGDFSEVSTQQAAKIDASYPEMNGRIMNDETEATPISTALDNVDYER